MHWINDLSKTLKADPKKTGSLGVLLAVFAFMLGRIFLAGSSGQPATAGATSLGPAIANGVASGSDAPVPGQQTARAGGTLAAIQKWSDGPVPPVSRNIFAVRMDYFPLESSRTTPADNGNDGFWDKLKKSMDQRTDDRQRHENLIASFTLDAEKLKLQSIMMGSTPRAMIDGQLVGVGSVVADFRVAKIETRRVIVEREGIMLEIKMK
jgi:hypothetical protein